MRSANGKKLYSTYYYCLLLSARQFIEDVYNFLKLVFFLHAKNIIFLLWSF
jgi:hypothetical protein